MSGDRSQLDRDERDLLQRACARNQSAEIHYEQDGMLQTARMRLIALEANEIHIDQPQAIGREVQIGAGAPLTVYFDDGDVMYAFTTAVKRHIVMVDLNEQKRIIGMALHLPPTVRQEQRRQDFRISLASYEIDAAFHAAAPDSLDAAPIRAARAAGRATNISAGGIAVLVETRHCPPLTIGETVFVVFELPRVPQALIFPAELRSLRKVHLDQERIFGLRFLVLPSAEARLQVRRIAGFIADEQRRKLRRGKPGGRL